MGNQQGRISLLLRLQPGCRGSGWLHDIQEEGRRVQHPSAIKMPSDQLDRLGTNSFDQTLVKKVLRISLPIFWFIRPFQD